MNAIVDEITRSIAGKSSLADCNVDDLRQIASQYPYFSPAQLVFTKKLKEENSFSYEGQLHKAFLYFQNPLWLHFLLHDTIPANIPSRVEIETEELKNVPEPADIKEEVIEETVQEEELALAGDDELKADDGGEHPLPSFKFQPIDPGKAAMTFEPYHTVDYFASQGIKVKEEEKPKDKFTVQLKSFTEWLKAMKKLPPAEVAAQVSPSDEKKVEQMAAVSINDREVVTEAMAEVWEKQGNLPKAREIYQKLSLLYPAKSSYFAAKIEHLKNL